eukprot:scaffold5889_cov99-Amphora_coffeaeformis.AAC.1
MSHKAVGPFIHRHVKTFELVVHHGKVEVGRIPVSRCRRAIFLEETFDLVARPTVDDLSLAE